MELRTIDASISKELASVPPVDIEALPLNCEKIPSHVSNLAECARNEVRKLLVKSRLTQEEEDSLDDGFALCDLSVIHSKLRTWRKLFPRVKPFFALKCNPDKMVAAVLGQQSNQAGFDCASVPEIKLALQATNGDPKQCIYANPQRAESDLDQALQLGVEALTFDGSEELHKVRLAYQAQGRTHEQSTPEMILRLLVPDSSSSVPLGEKFGAPPSKVESLVREAMDLGLTIVGVSFHCGSGCHDPKAYTDALQLAKQAIDIINSIQINYQCRLLDIGGGFPGADGAVCDQGRFCGKPQTDCFVESTAETAADIAAAVTPLLNELFPDNDSPIQFISEPGRYFVEEAFAVCSRIYSVRVESTDFDEQPRRHYYIAQGVHGVFKDVLLCNESFLPIPLQMAESTRNNGTKAVSINSLFATTIHGPSGEPYDLVCHDCQLPPLQIGDWLIFDRMGAYTLSIAARSGSIPVRYVLGTCGPK